jgi:hypothetical protein
MMHIGNRWYAEGEPMTVRENYPRTQDTDGSVHFDIETRPFSGSVNTLLDCLNFPKLTHFLELLFGVVSDEH